MKFAAAFAALLLLTPAADTIEFAPKAGTKLEKRIEQSMKMEKQSMTMTIGGQQIPAEALEDAVLEMSNSQKLVVVDEYREMGDGKPKILARTFETVTKLEESKTLMMGMPEVKEEKKDKKSGLTGKTVLFTLEKGDDYAKEWVGEGGTDELLEGLEEDVDLRELLPSKDVSKGDTWKLDLKDFDEVMGPGGKLGLDDDDDEEEDTDFEDNLEGELECTYQGVEEKDGRKLARITAVGKGKTFGDRMEGEANLHIDFNFDLQAEFLWDVGANHLVSYEMKGDVTATMKIQQEIEAQGAQHEIEIAIDLKGDLEIEGEFTTK